MRRLANKYVAAGEARQSSPASRQRRGAEPIACAVDPNMVLAIHNYELDVRPNLADRLLHAQGE
jgi:hypothetical protein